MKEYERKRKNAEETGTYVGLGLVVAIAASTLLVGNLTAFKYLYPPEPPVEITYLDFTEEEEEEVEKIIKRDEVAGPTVDETKPVEQVQQNITPVTAVQKTPDPPAAKPDNFGDVKVPEPEPKKEPEIDKRALFHGSSQKDTSATAPATTNNPKAEFKAGHQDGNVEKGKTDGTPNAEVEGFEVKAGTLGKPTVQIQSSGIVIIDIWVNPAGDVVKAQNSDKSNLANAALVKEALNLAQRAKFKRRADNTSTDALTKGTITYIFNLN